MQKTNKVLYTVAGLSLVVYSYFALAVDVGPLYIGKTPSELNYYVGTAGNATHVFVQKANYGRTINGFAAKCTSGTIKASLAIDGTDVTNCSGALAAGAGALSVSNSENSAECAVNNVALEGQTISLITDTNSTCLGLAVTVNETR